MASRGTPRQSYYSALQKNADLAYTDECLREVCLLVEHDAPEYYEGSVTPPTPDWMKANDESYGYSDESDDEEQIQRAHGCQSVPGAVPVSATTAPATNVYNPNDPLRYFLTNREIANDEYERWKIVHETPSQFTLQQQQQRRKRIDFGPGHNSDNSDSSGDDNDNNTQSTTIYGDGYTVLLHDGVLIDSWNPNPDPTPDRRYTALAKSREFMTRCLVDESDQQLASAFMLKLTWERFAFYPCHSLPWERYTLQNFWVENSLVIYEAMQTLIDAHARVNKGSEKMQANMVPPLYNLTPIETLETTFETIGRMCRCIAEDFNTQSVTAYTEEFIVALYREIVFITLVETHLRKQPFSAIFDKEAVTREWHEHQQHQQ
jgi:hypothetical protein